MSNDIGINERAIVLTGKNGIAGRLTDDREAKEIASQLGGRVSHHYGPSVIITEALGEENLAKKEMPGAIVADSMDSIPPEVLESLDPLGLAGLRAFHTRQSPEYAAAKANRPFQGESWSKILPPGGCVIEPAVSRKGPEAEDEFEYCKDELSGRLSGQISVTTVYVKGPGDQDLSTAEITEAIAEIQNGLSWMGSQSKSRNVTWLHEQIFVTLTVPDNPAAPDLEGLWRNPTMLQIAGDDTYPDAIQNFLKERRKSFNTDWAYMIFITRYTLGHFAYTVVRNGPFVVMDAKTIEMDRIIAHETGHIFHAPDEYAGVCNDKFGYFKTVNGNCISCFSAGQDNAKCIMDTNDWAMCKYTPWHVAYNGIFSPVYPSKNDPGPGIGGFNLLSEADQVFSYDFDSSGKPDHLVLYRPGEKLIKILKNDAGNFSSVFDSQNGIAGYLLDSPRDRIFAYDFDSSGKADHLFIYQPVGRKVTILRHDGGPNFTSVFSSTGGIDGYDLTVEEDRAFAFDFNSSGKLDHIVLYRPRFGAFFIVRHDGGANFSAVVHNSSGIAGFDMSNPLDRAFAFDFDGTCKLDHLVLYRPAFGLIVILKNNAGNFTPVFQSSTGIGKYPLDSPFDQVFAYDYNSTCKLDHLVLWRPKAKFFNTQTLAHVSIVKNNRGGTFSEVFASDNSIGGFPLDSDSNLIRAFPFDYSGNGVLDNLVFYRAGSGLITILSNAPNNDPQPTLSNP